MAYNQQQAPFWDFIRSFDQQGAGVDHPQFFGPPAHQAGPPHPGGAHPHHAPPPPSFGPFGFGGPWGGFGGWQGPHHGGRRGRHGRHDRREKQGEGSRSRSGSPDTMGPEGEKTDGEASPSGEEGHRGPRGFGKHGHGKGKGHCHGRGGRHGSRSGSPAAEGAEGEKSDGEIHRGPRGFGKRGHGHPHGGPHSHGPGFGPRGGRGGWGHHGRRGHPVGGMGGPRGPGPVGAFDLSGLFEALNSHPMSQQPWAQMLRQYAEQAGLTGDAARSGETLVPEDRNAENIFVPSIDVFSTEDAYILHIALPGAKKEDVGVNWDADKGVLNVAGIVYRKGDEEFLKTLSQSERKVGIFEREVRLPPGNEEKEEVDGDAITAKLEDGVLVVTVPKVEKEEHWTEVKRIDVL